MAKLNLQKSILIFTDAAQVTGAMVGNFGEMNPAITITAGMVRLLKQHYFDVQLNTTPKVDVLAKEIKLFNAIAGRKETAKVDELLGIGKAFVSQSTPQALGSIEIRDLEKPGIIKLDGVEHWHPAGTLQSRTVGTNKRIHFLQSIQTLKGKVSPILTVAAIELDPVSGPRIRAGGGSLGNACGVCSACGLCGLCGEINLGVAGAASAALWNIFSAKSVFEPTGQRIVKMKKLTKEDFKLPSVPKIVQ